MTKLILEIACGEKTCAKRRGEFCEYLGTRKFGSISVCMLFPTKFPQRKQNAATTELESENGWTMRCQECLDAEKADSDREEVGKIEARTKVLE